jgi:starvation-inducible outer membrane lipoprotein
MAVVICLAIAACAPGQIFPSEVTRGVEKQFDFTAWRTMPNAQAGRKVQLGGRIVQANNHDNRGPVIIVTQLPIVDHPAYGPKDTGRRSGEFAVFYAGPLEAKWLKPGNRVIVIGTTEQAKPVVVDDVKRTLPSLSARCLHIWNTGGKEIAEFPHNTGGGYEPLERETFCSS